LPYRIVFKLHIVPAALLHKTFGTGSILVLYKSVTSPLIYGLVTDLCWLSYEEEPDMKSKKLLPGGHRNLPLKIKEFDCTIIKDGAPVYWRRFACRAAVFALLFMNRVFFL